MQIENPSSRGISGRGTVLFGLVLASAAVSWRTLAALFKLAWSVDEYTHILLILPVSFSLIYLQRQKLRGASTAIVPGLVLGIVSIMIAVIARTSMTTPEASLSITVFSLVLFWIAALIGCYGLAVFKALVFPFLFLFLLVPPPIFVLDVAISYLQTQSANATYALFRLTGIPVFKTGFLLTFPTLQIEVAKECSGIRSSLMLLLTGLILAHLFLRSFWAKVVFVLCIVPFSVAKNAIRIFVLSTLGMYVDNGFLHGHLHHEGGIVFFLIALAGLLVLLWLLQRLEVRTLPRPLAKPIPIAENA